MTPRHEMAPAQTPETWYEASTGNHQGLVISEKNGRNVAVCYDKADAPLIATGPELLEAAKAMLDADPSSRVAQAKAAAALYQAISKAEGR